MWRWRLPLILLLALAARAVTFGNPILQVDEEFYLLVGRAMARGGWPYVDVWDRKPVGLFLLYLPAGLFGPVTGVWVYQAMALGFVVATALVLWRLAEEAGWRRGGWIAAALYVLWIDLVDGQGGQAPIFYNLFVAGAVLVAGRGLARSALPWRDSLLAMLLIGVSLQIKSSTVFEGLWIGLWLLWRAWRGGAAVARVIGYGTALVAVTLAPTLLALLIYTVAGHAEAFLYANFLSVLQRGSDPPWETLGNFGMLAAALAPLLIMAAIGGGVRPEVSAVTHWRAFLRGWLIFAVAGVLLFGSYFNHYALPVIAPAAVCAAAFLGERKWGRRLAWPTLILCAIAGQIVLQSERRGRGTPAQFRAIVDAIGHGPGCLYVYMGEPMLYTSAGRCTLTRYLFPNHLNQQRESGAVGIDQQAETRRVLAQKPAIIVLPNPYDGEARQVRAIVHVELQNHYRLRKALMLGRERVLIYARRGLPAGG